MLRFPGAARIRVRADAAARYGPRRDGPRGVEAPLPGRGVVRPRLRGTAPAGGYRPCRLLRPPAHRRPRLRGREDNRPGEGRICGASDSQVAKERRRSRLFSRQMSCRELHWVVREMQQKLSTKKHSVRFWWHSCLAGLWW